MNHIILGAKGKIHDAETVINKVKELSDKHNIELQLIDAGLIYGIEHLESAVMHAKRAMENKTNLAKSMAVEIILYASGERQISLAISKMGIGDDTSTVGIVLYGLPNEPSSEESVELCNNILQTLDLSTDESVLEGSREVLERFGITPRELEAVPESHWGNLILEKVAMVDIIK